MKAHLTVLREVTLLEPRVYRDVRGHFFESYNRRAFQDATGVDAEFVQDNQSHSVRHVLRGLHYQIRRAQGKLVRVLSGEIYDVAVDLRRSSAQFGKSMGVRLSAESMRSLWIPPGFAHGFLVTSDTAEVLYKVTDYYAPEHERTVRWNDPALAIEWPLTGDPLVAEKDERGALLRDAEVFE